MKRASFQNIESSIFSRNMSQQRPRRISAESMGSPLLRSTNGSKNTEVWMLNTLKNQKHSKNKMLV
jgi:hypothetical protein